MPKFESPIKVSGIQSLSGNTTLLHLGPDNRVGIGTTAPDTKLHVDGTITASGLIVPPGVLSDQGDSAAAFGFNPNFAEWNGPPDNSPYVANGYTQDTETTGRVIQSSDSNLGGASAKFDNVDARWERPVKFESPLYRDIFVQGTVTYKYESYSSGEPGLAVTLTSRPRACNEYTEMTNTFIVPTLSENRETATGWQTVTWRAHTPADREITDLKVEVISTSDVIYDAETREDVINDGGAGSSLTLGGGIAYEWYLDGFSLQFMHPDMRIDQLGRITGAYIAEATIDDLHIRDMISSTSSLVQREGTALYIQGEVANATYANGWSISKSGKIKATDIEIYSGSGQILIDANARDGDGHYNPFARWQGRSLADLDSDASSRLYGLNFEESNKTDLFIKTGYRATTGLDSDTIGTNDFSLYIANSTGTTLPDSGTGSTQLSNGSINFNGMTSNAPPGSIFTDGKSVVQGLRGSSDGTAAYILFLANTQKWDSNHGAQQKYHANTLLGEYGLYVIGKPTVGGWLYHPHANNTWYTIDDVQQGDRLHLKDFITIGKVGTDDAGNIIDSLTTLESPRALDSVTSDDSRGSFPPLGIPAGGILFADIYPNQWNHTANSGEVQLTNQKNSPNTRFAFIHPTSGTRYIANSSQGILTSLEDFPGSRYITFIGGNKTRTNPDGTGFTFDYDGHSPDFIAAFPLGNRWYYNQDEGKMSEFIPDPNIDCIVARVDSNGASFSGDGSSKITQVYRYAQREAVTEEGASLSDLIIDPPRGMASGGLVLADLTINREFQKSDNTFIANSGFIAFSNPENNPRNEFYVIHPDNGNNWLVDTVGRGVATSLNPTNDVYGTRHIAFVGDDATRFPAIASHYNVANDFIAVAKYDTNGNPRSDGQWYYDPGTGISDSHTFAPIANDFIIATLSSFDPDTDGIDQITRWAAEEGQLIIDGVPTSITSIRNLLNDRIDAANTVAQTALSEAQSAFANAVTAQANVAQALGLLDGAITIYFEEEDASRYYANALSSVDFDYNDLWINISTYNKAIDGSWYANAVFRYSNSLGGFADTGIDGPPTTKLAWRHDPTNPAGLSYLIGLTARGFADRSTTMYYRDSIGTPPNIFGPNVAVMSISSSDVGELNFNPEGDLWYDTKSDSVGSAPANHPYVYRTNATFSNSTPSRSGYITTGVGAWAQTVHNVGTSGTWNRNTAQTGWWSLQDSSAGDAAAGIAGVQSAIDAERAEREAAIDRALINAETAQIAADREILAFFADSTDSPPTSSGNGDIWIHTDNAVDTNGTVNAGSVFVANTLNTGYPDGGSLNPPTRHWNQSPNNAIGLMYLQSYSAGVSGEFQRGSNIMPRGYSLWDAPATDYSITQTTNPTLEPNPYPISERNSNLTGAVNTSFGYIGTSSLSLTVGSPYASETYLTFADGLPVSSGSVFKPATWEDNGGRGVITIPKGKRWIFSYYAYSNSAVLPAAGSFGTLVWLRNLEKPYANAAYIHGIKDSFTETHKWQRFSGVLDFTTPVLLDDASRPKFGTGGFVSSGGARYKHPDVDAGTQVAETLYADEVDSLIFSVGQSLSLGEGLLGNTIFYDGFQLEEVPTTVFTPSQFKEPSQQSSIVFGREITDGKIVAHFGPHYGDASQWYGPIPNITPGGLPNPEPHGDRWINTSNNNIEFVYNQSGVDVTTQTAFWTTSTIHGSGWYTAEDPRTTNALSTSFDALANAETAQAAADREIIAFFQTDEPSHSASGNGDIWIDTDSFATLNTSSIYVFRQDIPAYINSPTSAIGQVYLNSFLAERKASRAESLAISITGSGDLPFPVAPDANGIFVGATGNLAFYRNSSIEYLTDQFGSSHEGHVYVTNRGGVDLVGPNGHIWYPYSSGFGIPEEGTVGTNFYTGGATPDSLTVSNSTFSSLYLMYSNMNAATRFSGGTGTPFGTHDHIVPVRWNNVDGQHQWEAVERNGTLHDFIPDAANGDFLVAKLTRPTAVPEGFSTLDSWIFKTLPSQTQAFTDGKIVTHFGPQSPVLTGTHGPRANLTPTGLANPEPHGDFWINTSNNNLIFRYHSNTTNRWAQTAFHAPTKPEDAADQSGWYSTEDLRTANNEAYNANNQIWLTDINGNVFTLNAASANAQLYINFAFANIAFVNGTAYNAQAAADLAQASADKEILAYFQINTDVPEASGNGDVWIHTDNLIKPDGTLNAAAIFVANTHDTVVGIPDKTVSPDHWWYSSPENAIGLMYAKSYAAGHAGEFDRSTNIMPRAWSLFDASSSLYSNNAVEMLRVPYPIYDFSSSSPTARKISWEIVDDQNPPSGGKAFYLKKFLSTGSYGFFATTEPNSESGWAKSITIPRGKKWILSWYAKNAAGATTGIDSGVVPTLSNTFITESGTSYLSPYVMIYPQGLAEGDTQNFVGTDWERHWVAFDLTDTCGASGNGSILGSGIDGTTGVYFPPGGTAFSGTDSANGINQLCVRIDPGGIHGPTSIADSPTYYAGFQLEDVTASGRVVPSEFQEPSDTSALIFDREISDGKIVTQYYNADQSVSGGVRYGPQANVTPSGLPNPEPHGDFLIDTGNNNIMFRYHQKIPSARAFDPDHSTFAQTLIYTTGGATTGVSTDGWYALEDPRTANNEAYNANNQIWLTNIDGNVFTLNAASANAQLFINFAFANIAFVNGAAYNAQAAADLARISADREILAYFRISTDVPNASGNGDVWIHTDTLIDPADGTLNPAAIFVANTKSGGIPDKTVSPDHWWYSSPENAIGLMYAKSYFSGQSGEFDRSTNIMPRGLSLFDSPVGDYNLNDGTIATGNELYAINSYTLGTTDISTAEMITDVTAPFGDKVLELSTPTHSGTDHYRRFIFANTEVNSKGLLAGQPKISAFDKYGINIPSNSKWNFSTYVKNVSEVTTGFYLSVYTANATHSQHNYEYLQYGDIGEITSPSGSNTWKRAHFNFDLTTATNPTDGSDTHNRAIIGLAHYGFAGRKFRYHGLQLQDVTNSNRTTPSVFQEPSDASSIVFGREITDGKIVTQYYASDPQSIGYGPQANVTPTGLPNPEPHGDFLVDTSNNNIMFRYHQNIPSARVWSPDSTFAQTLIYTSPAPGDADGWYALEDPRTSNALATAHNANAVAHNANTKAVEALQRAASAASAADAEILVFFESSTNASMYLDTYNYGSSTGPATGNGDIWVQVDQVYNPDGTQNTGSIFFANLSPGIGWSQSPDNAIGRAFLESFTTTGVKNWMPAGYSTWNEEQQNFFGAPIVYHIGTSGHNADTPYPVIPVRGKAIVNTSFGYIGPGSIQLTATDAVRSPDTNRARFVLANTGAVLSKSTAVAGPPASTLEIPRGKRWIFSYYAFTNTAFRDSNGDATTTTLYIWLDNSANNTSNVGRLAKTEIIHTPDQWNRFSHVLDFSNTSPSATINEHPNINGSFPSAISQYTTDLLIEPAGGWQHPLVADLDSIIVRMDINGSAGNTFWFDGFQLEEAPGAQVLAGPFSDPDRRISDHFTRAISDGKIVSHYTNGASSASVYYGPRPQVTPSGTINPVPHGDFWIDTANNNATYRYNQNNSYPLPTTMVGASSSNAVAQTAFWSTVAYENNKTGWYSVADGRIGILAGNVATAFGDIADALDQVSDLEAATDGEINIYFKPADGVEFVTGGGPGTGGTPGSYAYGDIWINVADSQKYANGTLNPTSIHRRSNSSGGFHDASSLPVAGDAYRWKQEAENAIGGVYLSAYAAQNLADSKVTSFFTGNTNGGNEFLGEEGPGGNPVHLYGPVANLTPTGHINTNPDGDIWINTANNNEMYVYNVKDGGGAGGYRQRVYWSATMSEEGWYSSEDLRVGSHQIALDLAKASGADRHAQIFYSISNPTTSTGNGDIWIDTSSPLNRDGSANTLSIYIANTTGPGFGGDYGAADSVPTRYWNLDQTSALGRSALDGYNADQKSARAEFIDLIKNQTARSDGYSFPFPIYPEPNGIMGVGATGNVAFWPNKQSTLYTGSGTNNLEPTKYVDNAGEILVLNEGSIDFIGPDGIKRTIPTSGTVWTRLELSAVQTGSGFSNSHYIMYTKTIDTTRFPGSGGSWGSADNFVHVVWAPEHGSSWYAYPNDNSNIPSEHAFVPDADEGDFLVAQLHKEIPGIFGIRVDSFVLDSVNLPQQLKSYSDGKTVNFVSNTFHSGSSEDHAHGPNPSTTPNGLINPEPYGDKWISMSSPYKTYLYFSNATNKTAQTAFHTPVGPLAIAKYADTRWPFGTTNNNSGWYEYRDTGDALTQEGFQVALGQVSIGAAHWSENGQLVLDNITFDDDTDAGTAPAVVVTNTRDFGPNKELLLNPVPPPDQNLHAHWTFNSMGVDGNSEGTRYIYDVSGRGNHALVHDFTDNQAVFSPHDPAQDVINVSGNHSLYSEGTTSVATSGGIVLGVHGDGERTTLQDGSKIPVDISDTVLFNKQTWTLWFKPGSTITAEDRIITRDANYTWSLRATGVPDLGTENDEIQLSWNTYNPIDVAGSISIPIDSAEAGWYGNNVHDTPTPKHGALKINTWHFITISYDYIGQNSELWLYREGEGLIYHKTQAMSAGRTTAVNHTLTLTDPDERYRAVKLLENSESASGTVQTSNRAHGWVDEVRLYNSLLTPRNIRYLYMNPTGRPQQLQPRPGIGVKKGYAQFHDGGWLDISHGIYANGYAYFHGFDVDGNPADEDPYISFDGRVKYLKRGKAQLGMPNSAQGSKYLGNTGYILYNDTAYTDEYTVGDSISNENQNYVFAMPIGANTTQTHTWMYQEFWDSDNLPKIGWRYFTPDDSQDLVVGEAKLTDALGAPSAGYLMFDNVEAYQFARKPSIVRESYNFNITPQDFIGNFSGGDHFFANSYWWANNLINGVFIAEATIGNAAIIELSAGKIQAGTIGVGVKVGGENKILLDGLNNRIVISD